MGLFDKWKKGSSNPLSQQASTSGGSHSSNVPAYENAIELLNSSDIIKEYQGRKMMTDLAWGSGKNDPRICLWMARDYEENGCPSAAATWYLNAVNSGAQEAEADYKRCYNPYHIDEYYAIDGERGSGTPHLRYSEEMKAKQKAAFDECIQKLKSNPSREEIDQCIEIMRQLANAQRGYPSAMQWMGEYFEMVLHDADGSAKWYDKATKAGIKNVFAQQLLGEEIIERLGGNKKERDKKSLYVQYSAVAKEHGLIAGSKASFVRDIFQPKPFCEKAFDYCNKQYVDKGEEKLCFEYCMTAFYGAICIAALWKKDPDFNTDSTWDSLYVQINVEFTDANAERLLGTKQGEEKAESIYAIVHEYIKHAMTVLIPCGNEREMSLYAMEYAYRLGLLVAEKELAISMDFPVSEVVLNSEKKSEENSVENSSSKIKSVNFFYAQCTFGFQKAAMALGVAEKGLKTVPELITYGEKTILAFLRDPFFRNTCGDDIRAYYYLIMSLSIEAGIVYAAKWYEDFAGLPEYVDKIIAVGPADDANDLLRRYFPANISTDQGNPFFQKIYSLLLEFHEPYWELEDPREYMFSAMLAAYRLGVSMMLAKFNL